MTVRAFLAVAPGPRHLVACHRNGTYSYWCPLNERWVTHAASVPEHALIVLPEEEARVRRAMWRAMAPNPTDHQAPASGALVHPVVGRISESGEKP